MTRDLGGRPDGLRAASDPVLRVGVLGGTFDPPHLGHLVLAQDVAAAVDLERVLFMPAGVPPHRPRGAVAAAELRREMIEAAVADDPRFEVWAGELERPGPSFTVDSLEALRRERPSDELFLILGSDQFGTFDTWRRPDRIVELATLVVADRAGRAPEPSKWAARVVPVTRIELSSTEIRRRVCAGTPFRYLVPDAVRRIIRREGLYQQG